MSRRAAQPKREDVTTRAAVPNIRSVAQDQLTPDTLTQALGLIWFGERPAGLPDDLPCLEVAMPLLGQPSRGLGELWQAASVRHGQQDGIRYRADDQLLFGVMHLDETEFAPSAEASALQQASEAAYSQLFALLREQGYPHLWRTWNYLARINDTRSELERYRQFNIGRQTAFAANELPVDTTAPAACALGTDAGPLAIGFLAGRDAPLLLENPRQVSAYHYPRNYGPRSPTFSRAALGNWREDSDGPAILLISGTSSIVDHRSVHVGDVRAQTRETLTNIATLLDEAARLAPRTGRFSPGQLHYRVYVRHAEDLPAVQAEITATLGPDIDAVYVQADVCRQDLLVEIEATAVAQH